MKKMALIGTVFLAVFPFLGFAQSGGYDQRSYARMSYVRGDVYVQRGQDLGYEQGAVNLVVVTGDKLGTKDGRLEIQLGNRKYLRLDNYTQIDVVNLPTRDGDPTKIHVLSGSAFVRVNNLEGEKSFEIHSPDASFYLLAEGLYRVDVRENRETEFSVLSGQAEAAGEEGSVLVKSGEQVVAANGRFVSQPVSLSLRRDEFNSWNETRDALFARSAARTYLPAEYSDYESELADNGRWTYESSYGNVWIPTVSSADWRPYSYGRWVWYPIIGWTWVSGEPWGWCTSHYGRWGWGGGLGWYWIPQNHWAWGPAWVHWYWDNDYIGWCPLSYYNYPAVIVNNYFYDRYTDNYFPNNSRTLTMVHRNQLQNRRISDVALSRSRINQMGRLSLRGMQPQVRPDVTRNGQIATRAKSVLSRENLRSVNKSFGAGSDVRSNPIRRSGDSASGVVKDNRFVPREGARQGNADIRTAPGNRMNDPRVSPGKNYELSPGRSNPRDISPDETRSRPNQDSGRVIKMYPSERNSGEAVPRSQERIGGDPSIRSGAPSLPRSNEKNLQNSFPGRDTVNRDGFREFPSREVNGQKTSPAVRPGSPLGGQNTEGRRTFSSSPGVNSGDRPGGGKSQAQEYQPRGLNTQSPQRESSPRAIKERSPSGGRNSGGSSYTTSPQRFSSPPKNENSRSYDSPRRIAPRENSSSSKGYSSSPNYGSSSRSYNTPSKGYSSSPGYASPSRSSGAPSRSYSSPSRSYSSPGRSSMSAPSRSYSAPSRSYSAPSKGSGSSSGSFGGSSRSSSGSGSGSSKGSSSSSSSGGGGGGRKK